MKFEKFKFKDSQSGKETTYTCNESKLSNLFGANPNAPNFLTKVFFKEEVLDKYYGKPSKYSIDDGYLFYVRDDGINEWGMPIDNNAEDCVMVYLGDLGKMPYEEQRYWKLHNIIDSNISKVSFERDFKAEFCSPTEPALFFKEKISIFNKKWLKKFGWWLFKPLNVEDEHHLKTLRIPNNEQKDFDEQVLSLTKILIDSLNQAEMKKNLTFEDKDQSIAILEKYLEQGHKLKSSQMKNYLRDLQELRSRGSAHRKSKDYSNFYSKFDKGDFSKTFEGIITGAIMVLNTIENKLLDEDKNE